MTLQPDSAHDAHDPMLIAAHAAGDLLGQAAAAATAQIADCEDCAALDADLRVLAASVRALPAAAHGPRDYRLTAEQAARLRGGSWWRRAARAISEPRGLGRPFATAFTTLGLVGLLLGSLPGGVVPLLTVGSADRETHIAAASSANPSAAPEANPPTDASGAFLPDEHGTDGRTNYGGGGGIGAGPGKATDPPKSGNDEVVPALTEEDRGAPTVNMPLIAWSTAFLLIGLSLFAFRRFGRRLA